MRPDMTGALDAFDEMVEALEENEDMVECKECFDLFPKADCEKSEVGYVCPVCKGLRTAPAKAEFVDPYDCYTQDFPEVTDYNPDGFVDYEKEPDLGDALADLIKDEYEAIDGYEIADETIQKADIEEDEKDEILDTLDHIKEEEEEHIDELKELCPECDTEDPKEDEPEKDSEEFEKLDEAAEEDPEEESEEELEDEEDSEEAEDEDPEGEEPDEEVLDLDAAYAAALEVANETGVGQVFGYAKKDTEEFVAIDLLEVDDPEAIEQDLEAVYDDMGYAYVAFPEKTLEESLFESVQLTEAPHPFLHKRLDNLFKNGYLIVPSGSEAARKDTTIGINGRKAKSYADAVKAATAASKKYAGSKIHIVPAKLDQEPEELEVQNLLTPKNNPDLAKYGYNPIASFTAGKAASDKNQATNLAKLIKQIEKSDKKMKKALGVESDKKAAADANLASAIDSDVEVPEEEEATPAVEDEATLASEVNATDDAADDATDDASKADTNAAAEPEEVGDKESEEEVKVDTTPIATENFELIDSIFKNGYAYAIDKEGKPYQGGTSCEALLKKLTTVSKSTSEKQQLTYYLLAKAIGVDNFEKNGSSILSELNTCAKGIELPKVLSGYRGKYYLAAMVKAGNRLEVKNKDLLVRIGNKADMFNELLSGEDVDSAEADDVTSNEEDELQANSAKTSPEATSDETSSAPESSAAESSDETDGVTEPKAIPNVQNAKMSAKNIAKILRKAGIPLSRAQNKTLRALLGESVTGSVDPLTEEYHKYANPAEIAAMEKIELMIIDAMSQVYSDLAAWGYTAKEVDSQSWLCSNNENCIQYMVHFENLDPDEIEDLATQLQNTLENEAKNYKCPAEILGIEVSVALPDYDLEDEDDAAQGITRASFLFYVTFARNLI